MDRDLQMETLLTKPYALIDILPKQVLPNFLEDFSKAEHFFLSRKERSRFAEKIVRSRGVKITPGKIKKQPEVHK